MASLLRFAGALVLRPRLFNQDGPTTPIENRYFMKCTDSRFLAVAVLFLLALILPLACVGQKITVIDPNAASSKSVEDLSNAALNGSQLHADPPVLLEKAENKDFTREFVAVQWRPGDRIYLYVVRPTKVQKPPVAIYIYGHPSDTDRFQDDGWCQRTTSGGYAAVGLVPALTGQRYHDRPMKQWFVSEFQEALGKSAHDVQMVVNYLAERGDVDMGNVGVFGVGAGGTIAVMAASVDSRIKAIDLLDPWGDWPAWVQHSEVIPNEERPAYVTSEFLKKVAAFDPVKLLPALKTPHIRLNQLNDDFPSTPEEAKKRMEEALPATAEHHRFETSMAFFSGVASGGRVYDWLKLQIKATEPKVREATKETSPSAVSGQEATEARKAGARTVEF
jgi:Dienelactone hydrolase family